MWRPSAWPTAGGLLNHFVVPFWVAVPVAVIALDLVIWMQHVMVHAVPVLWRLHQVHHADLDFDVTTGARFHPIEIALSMLIKLATISVLGPPVLAVLIFEVLLNATAMFNHGNVRLPAALDRVLRWFVVTPDMHRVHHSVEADETNSNFGFNLPWWDRLFGTYRAQPRAGHDAMTIGIDGHTDPREAAPGPHVADAQPRHCGAKRRSAAACSGLISPQHTPTKRLGPHGESHERLRSISTTTPPRRSRLKCSMRCCRGCVGSSAIRPVPTRTAGVPRRPLPRRASRWPS